MAFLAEVFEAKNQATAEAITLMLAPERREAKVALQRFRNGKPVWTLITTDNSYPQKVKA